MIIPRQQQANIQLLQVVACRYTGLRAILNPTPISPISLDLTWDSMLEWMMLRPHLGGSLTQVHKWVTAAAAAYTAAAAAVPEGVDSSALCCGFARLSVMYELAISTPLATSSARLHSSVHCSTSSFLGRRSVTLLEQCATASEGLP